MDKVICIQTGMCMRNEMVVRTHPIQKGKVSYILTCKMISIEWFYISSLSKFGFINDIKKKKKTLFLFQIRHPRTSCSSTQSS